MTDLAEALSFSPLTIPAEQLKEVDLGRAFPGVLIATAGVRIHGAIRQYQTWAEARQACRYLLEARKAGGSKALLLMVVNDPAADLAQLAEEGLPLGLVFLQAETPKQRAAQPYLDRRCELLTDDLLLVPSSRAGSPNLLPC